MALREWKLPLKAKRPRNPISIKADEWPHPADLTLTPSQIAANVNRGSGIAHLAGCPLIRSEV